MCKIFGYARVSTKSQKLQRQIDMITAAYPNDDIIFVTDKFTGKTTDRPGFSKLLKNVKAGDTIVFEAVDRMSRNGEEGAALYEELYNRGVELVFLKNPNINTSVYRDQIQKRLDVDIEGKGVIFESVAELIEWVNRLFVNLAKEQVRLAFDNSEEFLTTMSRRTKGGIEQARLNGKQIGRPGGKKYTTKKEKEAREKILKHSRTFGGSLNDKEMWEFCKISRNTYYSYKRKLLAEQSKADQVTE